MTVYTLFGQSGGGSLTSDATNYTMGMEFSLAQAATLTGIWFWSPSGATSLPDSCAIYQITGSNTGSQVSGTLQSSPSWSGAAGSGWVKCSYSGSVVLAASTNYRVCIHHVFGSGANFYGATSHYWDTGAGQNGLTSGIITAPKSSAADGSNQDAYITSASIAYPNTSFGAANYWVDVEVTVTAPPSDSDAAAGADAGSVTASLPGSDTATGGEGTPSIGLSGSDAGSGADSGSVTLGVASSDTGSGADAGSLTAAVPGAEAGSGADAGSVTAAVPGSDSGTGSDTGTASVAVAGADTGSGAESATAAASGTVPELRAGLLGGTVNARSAF